MRALLFIRTYAALTIVLCFLAAGNAGCGGEPPSTPMQIKVRVDASDAPRGIFHADLQLPCTAGPLTLIYPKWIPGEHSPSGPIMQLVGMKFSTSGKHVSWQRDPNDMFTFHCDIPEEATLLDISLEYLSPPAAFTGGFGNSPNTTGSLLILLWNHILVYPESETTDNILCEPSLRLPQGWKVATALSVKGQRNDTVWFDTLSLTRLVDSPVMAGENIRSIPLSEGDDAPVVLNLVADSPEALAADSSKIMLCRNVVREADSIFGVRHFRNYQFLVALSDFLDTDGLEHRESADIRLPERALLDENLWKRRSYLIPHEYVHSWNGKFRRPGGLLATDYQQPVQSDLLWVYEGLTRYLDVVLTGRSGLRTPDEVRDYLAWAAGYLNHNRPGRSWRSLNDASVSAQIIYPAPDEWTAWRRGWMDTYDEGALIWLEADAVIRELTGGKHSLDDFCRDFLGTNKADTSTVSSYALEDIVEALDEIAHHDWQTFFSDRLNSLEAQAPLDGLTRSGWELVYSDLPNSYVALREGLERRIDAMHSIGISVFDDGVVQDVIPGTPGFQAGIAPGMRVTRVNGKPWSLPGLREAIARAKKPGTVIELALRRGRRQVVSRIDYHEGEKYPHLRRVEGKNDLLERIIAPRRSDGRG